MIDVSIVIVCMNNLKNLYLCLESIEKYTNKVTYETLVVAYLFSKENIEKVKVSFPWVSFIESNEIRGFSENNNLALRQAKGKYCFVLNDDTEMKMPVIDRLVETIENLPADVAVVSPRSVFGDGTFQSCGRPKYTFRTFVLQQFKLWNEQKTKSAYVNQKGVFQTYNLWGAFFLIKTAVFRNMGWFDERYFFCPEDIALSDSLNKMGYKCYVNANIVITHYEGMSGKSLSMIQTATRPAQAKGMAIYLSQGKSYRYIIISVWLCLFSIFQFLFHSVKSLSKKKPNEDYILSIGDINVLRSILTSKTPKEICIKYYSAIRQ